MTTYSFASWERTRALTSRNSLGKIWTFTDKLSSPPSSRRSSKPGPETFWPTSLDQESYKAARILRSFCKDGFYDEEVASTPEGPRLKRRAIKKVPSSFISRAQGLAIFTVMRAGLWNSGGSGVLIARRPDGGWSAPSAILLHSAALEFLVGTDIYDCLVIINDRSALNLFQASRCPLVPELGTAVGPVAEDGQVVEASGADKSTPAVLTYLKTRGYHVDISMDGALITERADENERFYGERLTVADILARKPKSLPREIKTLMATIKVAQADKDADPSMMPAEPAPGDVMFERPDHIFGVPDSGDPDPYGVHALGLEGVEIREAGSRSRPSSEQFEYRPSPTSPLYHSFHHRRSASSLSGRTKESYGRRSVDRYMQPVDTAMQTPDSSMDNLRKVDERDLADKANHGGFLGTVLDDDDPEHGLTDEPVDIYEDVQAEAAAPQILKARMITIPKKPLPPALPARSPARPKVGSNGQPIANGAGSQDSVRTASGSMVSQGCGTNGSFSGQLRAVANGTRTLSTPPKSPEVDSISSMLASPQPALTNGVRRAEAEFGGSRRSSHGGFEPNGKTGPTSESEPSSPLPASSTALKLPPVVALQHEKTPVMA